LPSSSGFWRILYNSCSAQILVDVSAVLDVWDYFSRPIPEILLMSLKSKALVRYANADLIRRKGVTAETFREIYQGGAPWEIGRPQPAVIELERAGEFQGLVLDVGCGRGENAFFLAEQGHSVCAIDFVDVVVDEARQEMECRGLFVEFRVMNATEVDRILGRFDTVLDSATFHSLSRDQRTQYSRALYRATNRGAVAHLICLSELERRPGGPPRITRDEIQEAFAEGWRVAAIRETTYSASIFPGGARAWAAKIERVDD
jgi:SAM-dependent methyltransferase